MKTTHFTTYLHNGDTKNGNKKIAAEGINHKITHKEIMIRPYNTKSK